MKLTPLKIVLLCLHGLLGTKEPFDELQGKKKKTKENHMKMCCFGQ